MACAVDQIMDDEEYVQLVGTHKPGSIIRIVLKNFLTHGHVVIEPGPRLNIVVGANGTGKSTILNAICLGLGGDPKLLGRADDLREFIMHEKETAEIVIELQNFDQSETHIIRRVIDRSKGSDRGKGRGASTFYINDVQCKTENVRALVSSTYGISIDNLCTFLPQDKVGNFSSLSDECRLLETEKTLSLNGYYYDIHQKLIQEELDMEKSVLDVDSLQDKLDKLMYDFERLEREKAIIEEREKALAIIDLLKKKRKWLEFEELREQATELKEAKDEIKKQLKKAHALLVPLEERLEVISSQKNIMLAKQKTLDQSTQRCSKEIEKQEMKFEKHDDEIESIIAKLNEIDTRHAKLQEQLQVAQVRLQELQQTLQSSPDKEATEADYKKSCELKKSVRIELDAARKEDRTLKCKFKEDEEKFKNVQQKLLKLNDDKSHRREKLFREKPALGTIYEWIGKNGNRFRRPICGPICLELNFKTNNAAALVENHVSNNILFSFVVETKEDYDLLYETARKELKVPINVLLVRNVETDVKRQYSQAKMQLLKEQHGVEGYLDETFTAPDTVMQALRDQSGVHKVLVGGATTQHSIDTKNLLQLLSKGDPALGQRDLINSAIFVAKNNEEVFRHVQSVSRYRGMFSATTQIGSTPRILAKGVDPEQITLVQNEIDQIQQGLALLRPEIQRSDQSLLELQSKLQEIQLQTESFKQIFDSYLKMEQKIARQESKINEIQTELDYDEVNEKNELTKNLMNRVAAAITAMECHQQQRSNMIKYTIASAGVTINQTALSASERCAKNELNEKKESFHDLERKGTEIQKRFQDVKQKAGQKKKEAEEFAPLVDRDGNELPLKTELEQIEQHDLVEVDAAIEEVERSIDGIHDNPDAIRQYEKLKKEIVDLREKLDSVRGSRESKMTMLNKMREPWEAALDAHVTKVNTLFTKYMEEMGCTGEVRLKKGSTNDEEGNVSVKGNFKDWGIEILVSFREGARAQILSAERHSGGERSVSTILYLMALQDLMVAPFRCVDEINQGLDDRNERLVFKRIVQNSCGRPKKRGLTDHSGQYFLITPKLLPNLTDMEEHAVTVLFVCNGVYNFKHPEELKFSELEKQTSPTRGSANKKVRKEIDTDENKENGNARIARKSKKQR